MKAIVILCMLIMSSCAQEPQDFQTLPDFIEYSPQEYNPNFGPDNFVSAITNKYFPLTPGTMLTYEGKTENGIERVEVAVTNETKVVFGVQVTVVQDREFLNGELVEDTKDWFAQDKEGNVWYFGEATAKIIDGRVVSTKGSWEAGVDGALPGIIMLANPTVGKTYRQEYYEGEAEDMGKVIELDAVAVTNYSSFTHCLKTEDWNPLESVYEIKIYCPGIGLVLEIDSEGEIIELTNITNTSNPISKKPSATHQPINTTSIPPITEQEAIALAKAKVNGTVIDVEIEKKFGKIAYVVEIRKNYEEIDVIIDKETGEVLGIEE